MGAGGTLSLQHRNGKPLGLSTVTRVLSEFRDGCERSRGVLGKRALWLSGLVESGKLTRGGSLAFPVKDPEGRWYTPEQDREARRLDRAIRLGIAVDSEGA